jgi:hypothetical protein
LLGSGYKPGVWLGRLFSHNKEAYKWYKSIWLTLKYSNRFFNFYARLIFIAIYASVHHLEHLSFDFMNKAILHPYIII